MSNLFVPQESADAYRESSLWKGWENIIPTDLYALDEYESRKLTDMGYGRFTEPVDVHGNYNYYSLDHENLTATFLQSRSSHPGKGEWFESLLHVTIPEYVLYDYKKYTVRILGDGCLRECYRLMDGQHSFHGEGIWEKLFYLQHAYGICHFARRCNHSWHRVLLGELYLED